MRFVTTVRLQTFPDKGKGRERVKGKGYRARKKGKCQRYIKLTGGKGNTNTLRLHLLYRGMGNAPLCFTQEM